MVLGNNQGPILKYWNFEYFNIQILEYSNIQILENGNIGILEY